MVQSARVGNARLALSVLLVTLAMPAAGGECSDYRAALARVEAAAAAYREHAPDQFTPEKREALSVWSDALDRLNRTAVSLRWTIDDSAAVAVLGALDAAREVGSVAEGAAARWYEQGLRKYDPVVLARFNTISTAVYEAREAFLLALCRERGE